MNKIINDCKKIIFSCIGICLMLCSSHTFALEINSDVVHIVADKMRFDMSSETSIYSGNVTLKQGDVELTGDHIEVKQENNTVISMTAKGDPAKYSQTTIDGNNIYAQSRLIQYFANNNQLVMIDQAKLQQDDQIIESERIVYNTKTQTLQAGQNPELNDNAQRVKITLTPNNKP